MNLMRGKAVNSPHVTEIPLTQMVINMVEKMANKDDIKNLKITNPNGESLFPGDSIAGVDFMEDDDPSKEDEEDDDDPDYESGEEDKDDPNNDEIYDRIVRAELDALFKDEEIKE